jgi:hypothetical protein
VETFHAIRHSTRTDIGNLWNIHARRGSGRKIVIMSCSICPRELGIMSEAFIHF